MSGEKPFDAKKLVDIIITEAYTKGASDVYLDSPVLPDKSRVLFWIDGDYQEYMTIPDHVADDIVKSIKSMGIFNVENPHKAQDGFIKIKSIDLSEFQLKVALYPTDGLREELVLSIMTA